MTTNLLVQSKNPFIAVTGRIKLWLEKPYKINPVSCTGVVVEDSYFEVDGDYDFLETIAGSRVFAHMALKGNAGCAIDLTKIRPKWIDNGQGIVSQGVENFLAMYSQVNAETRRGSLDYRNGAINLYLDSTHPDIFDFLNFPKSSIPWAKRSIYIGQEIFSPENEKLRKLVIQKLASGDIFLAKRRWDVHGERLYTQVCTVADTWIHTSDGQRQVKDLINQPFSTVVNGQEFLARECPVLEDGLHTANVVPGFFSTGFNPVVTVKTTEGYSQTVTLNHRFKMYDGSLIAAEDLGVGDRLEIVNQAESSCSVWGGVGTENEGYLVGYLVGNGNYYKDNSAELKFWNDNWTQKDVNKVFERIQDATASFSKTRAPLSLHNRESQPFSVVGSTLISTVAEKFGVTRDNKTATELIESSSSDFYRGFLQGYFDADGSVQSQPNGSKGSIQLSSISLKNLQQVQRMLIRLGIKSQIYKRRIAGDYLLPNGKGGSALYSCKQGWRLDISHKTNCKLFEERVGFLKSSKANALSLITQSDCKEYKRRMFCRVSEVIPAGIQETFTCSIDHPEHLYASNGFIQPQCTEIYFKSRSTCNLAHVNLGQIRKVKDIVPAFVDTMIFLCGVWESIDHTKTPYRNQSEDAQVGLGVIGLANMLSNFHVTYTEFVGALQSVLDLEVKYDTSIKALMVASEILEAFRHAGTVARSYGLERAFCIAPTATSAFNHTDYNGFTTTAEISPPVAHPLTKKLVRVSDSGSEEYQYPDNVEIAGVDVTFEVYFDLCCAWQQLMDIEGLAHAISFNVWDTAVVDEKFLQTWLDSPLYTTYYRWVVQQSAQDKTSLQGLEVSQEDEEFWTVDEDEETEFVSVCNMNKECTECAA